MKEIIFILLVIFLALASGCLNPICGDGRCDYREVDICPADCNETINTCSGTYEWCESQDRCIDPLIEICDQNQ